MFILQLVNFAGGIELQQSINKSQNYSREGNKSSSRY